LVPATVTVAAVASVCLRNERRFRRDTASLRVWGGWRRALLENTRSGAAGQTLSEIRRGFTAEDAENAERRQES
jgi:hypothetical protein